MKYRSTLLARSLLSLIVPVAITLFSLVPQQAQAASISPALQTLVSEGNSVATQLSGLALNQDNSCTQLGSVINSVKSFITAVETVKSNIPAPVSLDSDSLNALDELTLIATNIASTLPVLSADLSVILTSGGKLADVDAALSAMLNLSDDIGTMADRILEMADNILVMADNIGLMADRILLTQQIQSTNNALTQSTILTTQQNMVFLSSTINTQGYNLPLSDLISTGSTLVTDINNTPLTEANISTELAAFQIRVNSYLNSATTLLATVNSDSSMASHYINSDTLTMLGDLSTINAALATSLNSYANTVNTLAPNTNISILNEAIYSMLRLVSDIGSMANRIVEMGNKINIMADNIGLMAARIVETQTLQQSNLALTQSNLTTAQITSVSIIAAFGL